MVRCFLEVRDRFCNVLVMVFIVIGSFSKVVW